MGTRGTRGTGSDWRSTSRDRNPRVQGPCGEDACRQGESGHEQGEELHFDVSARVEVDSIGMMFSERIDKASVGVKTVFEATPVPFAQNQYSPYFARPVRIKRKYRRVSSRRLYRLLHTWVVNLEKANQCQPRYCREPTEPIETWVRA